MAKPKIQNLHYDHLGMFLWFLRVAWNPITRPYWIWQAKRTFTKMKEYRGYACSFFMWLSDGNPIEHRHLNQKTPWVFENKKFNLDKWNERYWELFRIFITMHKKNGIRPIPCVLMDRYCYAPFFNNHQGFRGFWTDEAFKYQRDLVERTLIEIKGVYSADYKPHIKLVNEAAHWGDHGLFHTIGDWHVKMWEEVVKKHTRLDHLVIDGSHCEAPFGEFDYPKDCQFCGRPMGNTEYVDGKKRKFLPEYHGLSTKLSFERLWACNPGVFGSLNWKQVKGSEDGAGKNGELGANPWGDFRIGTAQQIKEAVKYVWQNTDFRDGPARKTGIIGMFPMETFDVVNGQYLEQYTVNRIDWERYKKVREAWVAMFEK